MVGKRIIKLRNELGITQPVLAKALGISRSDLSLYEIEKREPEIATILKIADFFDVTVDYLLGRRIKVAHDEDVSSRATTSHGDVLKKLRALEDMAKTEIAETFGIPAKKRPDPDQKTLLRTALQLRLYRLQTYIPEDESGLSAQEEELLENYKQCIKSIRKEICGYLSEL